MLRRQRPIDVPDEPGAEKISNLLAVSEILNSYYAVQDSSFFLQPSQILVPCMNAMVTINIINCERDIYIPKCKIRPNNLYLQNLSVLIAHRIRS